MAENSGQNHINKWSHVTCISASRVTSYITNLLHTYTSAEDSAKNYENGPDPAISTNQQIFSFGMPNIPREPV
jgi:hypothetical protein